MKVLNLFFFFMITALVHSRTFGPGMESIMIKMEKLITTNDFVSSELEDESSLMTNIYNRLQCRCLPDIIIEASRTTFKWARYMYMMINNNDCSMTTTPPWYGLHNLKAEGTTDGNYTNLGIRTRLSESQNKISKMFILEHAVSSYPRLPLLDRHVSDIRNL